MPLEIALAVAGRGRIGLGVVEVGGLRRRRLEFLGGVGDPELREAPLVVLKELDLERPFVGGGVDEDELLAFDRIEFRRRAVPGIDGLERAVLEIDLHDGRLIAREADLIEAFDAGVFGGVVDGDDLQESRALDQHQQGEAGDQSADDETGT